MTENNISSASDTITMYCTQTDLVWDIVDKDGVNYVKQAYITKKYQDTAWIFDTAYKFFRQEAVKIISKPQEAESPIWMYRDKKWAVPNAGCRRMCLEIPKDELILFDQRTWTKILNMEYVGTDEEITAFEQEYKRQGVHDPLDIMKSAFYPLLAQKIKKSWQHLFTDPLPEETYWQGAVWYLKKKMGSRGRIMLYYKQELYLQTVQQRWMCSAACYFMEVTCHGKRAACCD